MAVVEVVKEEIKKEVAKVSLDEVLKQSGVVKDEGVKTD